VPADAIPKALAQIQRGEYEAARAALAPLVAAHPQWGRARFALALAWHKEKRYETARPLFERAIALEPAYAPAHLFFGWCLYYLGDLPAARREFGIYLAGEPDSADALIGAALVEMDDGHDTEAAARLERASSIAKQRGDAESEFRAQVRLGDLRAGRDDVAGALACYGRAIELRPESAEAWFKVARARSRSGDEAGAAEAMKTAGRLRDSVRAGTGGS
jgi:tetratricopeptide (TPR) repeat protein